MSNVPRVALPLFSTTTVTGVQVCNWKRPLNPNEYSNDNGAEFAGNGAALIITIAAKSINFEQWHWD